MAFLGFTGNDARLLTKLLKRRSKSFGVPWVAVLVSSVPGVFAFMTGSSRLSPAPQTVDL
jgi:amino acid permease